VLETNVQVGFRDEVRGDSGTVEDVAGVETLGGDLDLALDQQPRLDGGLGSGGEVAAELLVAVV